ncbi:MAG TPA: IS1595 family transposase [Terriglobia bacterium]|nr:IS1595 family transposase [Terriglobia bacterium]
MNLNDLAKNFSDEDKAREFLENMRWPDGVACPHCGVIGQAYKLEPKPGAKTHVRKGVWKCGSCREQFTVTVGTIFEDSHIPLNKWLMAIHLLCASKKGMSAHQLHRMLGVSYKSAWFMAHRIRYAMNEESSEKLSGIIEADETYIGGKVKGKGCFEGRQNKLPVVALVERNGRARSFHMEHVTAKNLRPVVDEYVQKGSSLMTDESGLYRSVSSHFASHDTVTHSMGEYVRKEPGKTVHTNTVEGYFSILKRGINGVYHHVGKQHLHRYLSEFDFRYNSRKEADGERALQALKGFEGKRLTYRTRTDSQK